MSFTKEPEDRVGSIAPFGLRLLPELRDRVVAAAKVNKRSINAEITARLEGTVDGPLVSRKASTLTVRLTDDVRARLEAAARLGPYPVSLTSIVERGIELAARELKVMAAAIGVDFKADESVVDALNREAEINLAEIEKDERGGRVDG